MNRWQQLFLDHYYKGDMPKDQRGIRQYELLSDIKDSVTVYFPRFESINGIKPEHTETYTVSETRCDMKNGIISAVVLSWQLLKWHDNGYRIESCKEDKKTA